LSEDGLLVPVVAINKQTGEIEGDPDLISRGLAQDASSAETLRDGTRLLSDVINGASLEERTDQGLIKEKIRVELRRFFRKRSGRRPLVVPVIMEV
jgi:ribonuclease J